jgi:hypothetical protein
MKTFKPWSFLALLVSLTALVGRSPAAPPGRPPRTQAKPAEVFALFVPSPREELEGKARQSSPTDLPDCPGPSVNPLDELRSQPMLTRKNVLLLLGLPVAGFVLALWWGRGLPTGWKWQKPSYEQFSDGQPDPDMARRMDAAHRRQELKREVIQQLLRGRLSLDQAAAQFESVDENDPDSRGKFRFYYEGSSDRERRYRQVLHWVKRTVEDESPSKAAAVLGRLEREMERNLISMSRSGEPSRAAPTNPSPRLTNQ